MLEPGSPLAEDRDDVDGLRGPVPGHEPGQLGEAVGHLQGEGQITDDLEEAHRQGQPVILDVPLLDAQAQHVEAADERARRDREQVEGADDDRGPGRRLGPTELGVAQDVDRGDRQEDGLRNEERGQVDRQAFQVLLDIGLVDLGQDAGGVGVAEHAVLAALLDHVAQPFLPDGGLEIELERLDEHDVEALFEVGLVRQEPVHRRGQEGERPVQNVIAGFFGDGQRPVFAHPARPVPADEGFGDVAAESAAEVSGFGQERRVVAAQVAPSPELADERPQERREPEQPQAGRPPRELRQEQDRREDRQEAEEDEEERREPVPGQRPGRGLVGHAADTPAFDPRGVDGRPKPRLRDQPDVVMRDVGLGIAVGPVGPLELFERAGHFSEGRRAGGRISLERFRIAPVELDETAPPDALDDQLEVRGTLRQEGQEGHAGPEIDGDEAAPRVGVRLRSLERVRLALHRPPLVLPGQLGSAHVVHERDEVVHERPLGPVLRRAQPRRRPPGLPLEPGEQVVVDLVAPEPAVHPLADLAAAAEHRVDEGGQDVDDRPRRAHALQRAPADELLPEGPGPGRVRIDLRGERRLEAQAVQGIADEAPESRDRDQDLQGVLPSPLEAIDGSLGRSDLEDADLVDLARVPAADVLFDGQLDARRPGRPDAPDFVLEDLQRLVAADAERPEESGGPEPPLELAHDAAGVFGSCHRLAFTRPGALRKLRGS